MRYFFTKAVSSCFKMFHAVSPCFILSHRVSCNFIILVLLLDCKI